MLDQRVYRVKGLHFFGQRFKCCDFSN